MSKLFVQVERVEDLMGRVDNYFGGGRVMTAVEKRKLLEFIDRCVRYDLLSDTDVNKILDICGAAVDRSIKKVKESE